MKRLSAALFALAFAVVSHQPLSAQVQGQWATTGTMQTGREFNAQVRISGGKVLSIGGVDSNSNVLASAEVFNASKWTLTGSMLQAREYFPAVVLKSGKVLVSGGLGTSGIILSEAELYDPTTGAWTSAGSLSVARYAHTATLLSNGKVLVTGGCAPTNCSSDAAVSELYDPTSNTWSTTGTLNTARYFHTALLLKTGKVLVVGGSPGITSCELYDPSAGTWSNAASTTTGRYLNSTTLLSDGKVLAAGGANGRFPIGSVEIYDPTANTWTSAGAMITPRYAHSAALLTDGTVVLAGGEGQSQSCGKDCTTYIPTSKVEIYNETAGTFTSATALNQALAYQAMTLLSTGKALENGGIGTTTICCVVESTASIYTPLTLTMSASSLNFGLEQIGLSSTSQSVTVTNVSTHSVTFTSITPSGDYAAPDTCPATLTAGQNCTITVTFTPTASGTRAGTLTFKDNSAGSPSQTVSLTGTGESLALGLTPSSLSFGSITPGTSKILTATLTNDGSAAVSITQISISPVNSTFTQTNNCPASLGVQQSCSLTIDFTPPDTGTYNATLSVTNGAGSAPTLPLTGMGLNN